jgi:hypothetical protein
MSTREFEGRRHAPQVEPKALFKPTGTKGRDRPLARGWCTHYFFPPFMILKLCGFFGAKLSLLGLSCFFSGPETGATRSSTATINSKSSDLTKRAFGMSSPNSAYTVINYIKLIGPLSRFLHSRTVALCLTFPSFSRADSLMFNKYTWQGA